MGNDQIPEAHELPNKPLVEAIFELRWALKTSPQGQPRDPGFRIALGRYWDCVRKDYPEVQDLPTAQIPEDMTAYTVRHRFRAGPEEWPLTQLGPGILTVNETSGYTWETFRPRLLAAIKAFSKSYPTDICELRPIRLQLRYIDAISYDPCDHDPCTFLAESLHTHRY